MLTTKGASHVTENHVELKLSETAGWPSLGDDVSFTVVLVGDEECGPLLFLTSVAPGIEIPVNAAHAHASDNFRISVRGTFTMGRTKYGPREFRFQQGWRPYPNDNSACGPDGGWELVMMADRRGSRVRPAADAPNDPIQRTMEQTVAQLFELRGDYVSDEPGSTSGPSALATQAGELDNSGKLNGSFTDSSSWPLVANATRASASVLGNVDRGPVMILVATAPHEVITPRFSSGTEVFRMVVGGGCVVDARRYEPGDIRVYRAGTWIPPTIAGESGMQEMILFGDRRFAHIECDDDSWLDGLPRTIDTLTSAVLAAAK